MKKRVKILGIIIMLSLIFTGCGKNQNLGVDSRINLTSPDGIKVETFYSIDNTNLIVKLTNETSNDIKALEISTDYSENNDVLKDDEVIVNNFKANSTTFASLLLPINQDFKSYIPNKINLIISNDSENLEKISDSSMYMNQINIDYKVENNIVYFNLANNTGKIMGSIDSIIIYYKDGKPIATDYIQAIDVEDNFDIERNIPYLDDSDEEKYIDYDNMEIIITKVQDNYDKLEELYPDFYNEKNS